MRRVGKALRSLALTVLLLTLAMGAFLPSIARADESSYYMYFNSTDSDDGFLRVEVLPGEQMDIRAVAMSCDEDENYYSLDYDEYDSIEWSIDSGSATITPDAIEKDVATLAVAEDAESGDEIYLTATLIIDGEEQDSYTETFNVVDAYYDIIPEEFELKKGQSVDVTPVLQCTTIDGEATVANVSWTWEYAENVSIEDNGDGSYTLTRNDERHASVNVVATFGEGDDVNEQWFYWYWYDDNAYETATWKRLAGETRYDTMQKIVQEMDSAGNVAVLASGENFPDALVASSVAGYYGCPIILTSPNKLSTQAKAEIERLDLDYVIIMGGNAAVSSTVESQIKKMGITSERIAGSNRFETSVKALERVGYTTWGWDEELDDWYELNEPIPNCDTVVVANGFKFADALSIAPYCYSRSVPILLTDEQGMLTNSEVATIKKFAPQRVVFVGGTAVVSDSIKNKLAGLDIEFVRLGGKDRYETSKLIAEWEINEIGMDTWGVCIASGANFPDALAGSALAGWNYSVMLLDGPGSKDHMATEAILDDYAVYNGYVLGGTNVISDERLERYKSLTTAEW